LTRVKRSAQDTHGLNTLNCNTERLRQRFQQRGRVSFAQA
jgi:hypothetical protein